MCVAFAVPLSVLTGCIPAVNATPATVVVDEVEVEEDREAQLAAYRANVAGFEQKAAETAVLASKLNTEMLDSADAKSDLAITGCPQGTIPWQRDVDTHVCTTECTTDADCGKKARCRLIREKEAYAPSFIDDVEKKAGDIGFCDSKFAALEKAMLVNDVEIAGGVEEDVVNE